MDIFGCGAAGGCPFGLGLNTVINSLVLDLAIQQWIVRLKIAIVIARRRIALTIDSDLVGRVNAFQVVYEPGSTETWPAGHLSVFRRNGDDSDLSCSFIYDFGQGAGEVAVGVGLLVEIAGYIPDGVEVDVVDGGSAFVPEAIQLKRKIQGLIVRRCDLIPVGKLFGEQDGVIMGPSKGPVLSAHEVTDGVLVILAEFLEKELEVAMLQEPIYGKVFVIVGEGHEGGIGNWRGDTGIRVAPLSDVILCLVEAPD